MSVPIYVEIYALSDPFTGFVRYVGKSNNSRKRFSRHLNEATNHHKSLWIKSIRNKGQRPILDILEATCVSSEEEWYELERWWISYMKFLGCPLTNLDSGGVRDKRISEDTKTKISNTKKGKRIHSEEHKRALSEFFKSIPRTPEWRLKISMALRGRKIPENARTALIKYHTGRPKPESERKKLSESLLRPGMKEKLGAHFRGKKWTQEFREKMRILQLKKKEAKSGSDLRQ